MISSRLDEANGGNSLAATLSGYLGRYRMVLYIPLCSGNFLERRLELELADGRRGISHHGRSAVHVYDAHVHEARGLQVILRT
jgi:hypothetical protein